MHVRCTIQNLYYSLLLHVIECFINYLLLILIVFFYNTFMILFFHVITLAAIISWKEELNCGIITPSLKKI